MSKMPQQLLNKISDYKKSVYGNQIEKNDRLIRLVLQRKCWTNLEEICLLIISFLSAFSISFFFSYFAFIVISF